MKTLLITGTDTDTGKTIITTALRAYYQRYFPHLRVGLMKLLQTGRDGDRQFYERFFADVITPISLAAPLAPPLAAEAENYSLDLGIIWNHLINLQQAKDLVLVEALGGLGSPVTRELTVADLAGTWRLDTILVVPVKLGAIAQAVANVALARQHKVKLKGIILNCVNPCSEEEIDRHAPQSLIESLTEVPILGCFPHLDNLQELDRFAAGALNLNITYLIQN